MKQRCYNKNLPKYECWGGRGIIVCDRWLKSFKNFLTDMGECPEGLTLDRKNNNGNYEPDNCKWSTWTEQFLNRRCKVCKPLHQLKNFQKYKMDKLKTKYNNSIIDPLTKIVYRNQTELAEQLEITHQAVSLHFRGITNKLKGCKYMMYKDYLIKRWRGFNILFKWVCF